MLDDPRCCGSGTCIIDAEGICWCGQRWEGTRLVGPASLCNATTADHPVHGLAVHRAEVTPDTARATAHTSAR